MYLRSSLVLYTSNIPGLLYILPDEFLDKNKAENPDVKEFYVGMSDEGRKSFRDVRSYRRRKRWLS